MSYCFAASIIVLPSQLLFCHFLQCIDPVPVSKFSLTSVYVKSRPAKPSVCWKFVPVLCHTSVSEQKVILLARDKEGYGIG